MSLSLSTRPYVTIQYCLPVLTTVHMSLSTKPCYFSYIITGPNIVLLFICHRPLLCTHLPLEGSVQWSCSSPSSPVHTTALTNCTRPDNIFPKCISFWRLLARYFFPSQNINFLPAVFYPEDICYNWCCPNSPNRASIYFLNSTPFVVCSQTSSATFRFTGLLSNPMTTDCWKVEAPRLTWGWRIMPSQILWLIPLSLVTLLIWSATLRLRRSDIHFIENLKGHRLVKDFLLNHKKVNLRVHAPHWRDNKTLGGGCIMKNISHICGLSNNYIQLPLRSQLQI